MEIIEKIKTDYNRLSKRSEYVNDYLFRADIRSSVFISIIISLFEISMIISGLVIKSVDNVDRNFKWVITHESAYIFFLLTAICMLIYSLRYLLGKKASKAFGYFIKLFFSITSLIFTVYISYFSPDKSGLTFCFLTAEIYILCLYIWHPVASLFISIISFGAFFYLQGLRAPVTYSMKVNGFSAWLFLYITGVNVYVQRKLEAEKNESLEALALRLKEKNVRDELTHLYNITHFNHAASIVLGTPGTRIEDFRFIFMDIKNFKNYNEKYGFKGGNDFLISVAQIIQEYFPASLVARFSDDHFVALTKENELYAKLDSINERIKQMENTINVGINTGIYKPTSSNINPGIACDYARYACSMIKKNYNLDYIEYDYAMSQDFKKKQYIINNIETAIKNEHIKVYYQPVVWANNSKLCGAEALARWDDPQFGLLPPTDFIPILEEYHLIHKLDMFIMETVCFDLNNAIKKGLPLTPVSINFSRLDFDLADPLIELDRCLNKYGIPKDYIHVEITESALSDSDTKLKEALENFRAQGYALWLDDFGAGYSGLNVLKDFNFDMMKIDMKFLSEFSENKKTQPILTSIIELAQKIGINTLTEGVETPEVQEFLKSIGCQRLQGFLFGKPMTKEDFEIRMKDGTFDVSAL